MARRRRSSRAPCARSAARPRRRPGRQVGAVARRWPLPAPREVPGDVGYGGAAIRLAASCQPSAAAHRVLVAVEAIAAERGQVDPADEGDLVVDDHELLVVAVHRTLAHVELAANTRCRGSAPRATLRTAARSGLNSGSGGPAHSSTRTSTRSASSASRSRSGRACGVARQAELRRRRASPRCARATARPIAASHRGERLLAVDQHLDVVAGADRCPGRPPAPALPGRQRLGPPQAVEPAPVVAAQHRLEAVAGLLVHPVEPRRQHHGSHRGVNTGSVVGFLTWPQHPSRRGTTRLSWAYRPRCRSRSSWSGSWRTPTSRCCSTRYDGSRPRPV